MSQLAIHGGTACANALRDANWPRLQTVDEAFVLDALRRNYWGGIGDDELPARRFEQEFASYHDSAHGIVVANGTDALELALRASGVRPGDEVLVPALTFIATASAVVAIGAVPIFVDVDAATAQLSVAAMRGSVSERTRAVIAVHYGGYPADLDALTSECNRLGLTLIEDCAHAQGASWRRRRVGSWGAFGCFSFQHSKSLAAGEGGIVITCDEQRFERALLFRDIGRRREPSEFDHYLAVGNPRLGGLQGALLLSQFGRFAAEAEERSRNVQWFESEVASVAGLSPMPPDDRVTQRGCYFVVMGFDEEQFGCSRAQFLEALRSEGVSWAGAGYNRPVYREPAFLDHNLAPLLHPSIRLPDYARLRLPNSERWAKRQVTIGHPYFVGDGTWATLVLEAVRKVRAHASALV